MKVLPVHGAQAQTTCKQVPPAASLLQNKFSISRRKAVLAHGDIPPSTATETACLQCFARAWATLRT
jgi:hypothetical protein